MGRESLQCFSACWGVGYVRGAIVSNDQKSIVSLNMYFVCFFDLPLGFLIVKTVLIVYTNIFIIGAWKFVCL